MMWPPFMMVMEMAMARARHASALRMHAFSSHHVVILRHRVMVAHLPRFTHAVLHHRAARFTHLLGRLHGGGLFRVVVGVRIGLWRRRGGRCRQRGRNDERCNRHGDGFLQTLETCGIGQNHRGRYA